MQDFADKKIVIGVCGGIAAYKSALLVRELTALGAEIRVIMTESAKSFISPLTFQALSGNTVRDTLFDAEAERAMSHIELARWADYLIIAPASANTIAKMAQGLADDLLSTVYLVAEVPIILCPAMNRSMWAHPATQANCALLQSRGVIMVGPGEGSQACGEYGLGRLSDVNEIINTLRLEAVGGLLKGQKVMITAGPTQEAIDPVRFISNHSSGKMGYALALAAKRAGAEVLLISGPTALTAPEGIISIQVETAVEMHKTVMEHLQSGIIFIGCAAVADYTIQHPYDEKIKRQESENLTLTLVKNPDILASVAESGKTALVIGFAAETQDILLHAQDKLKRKKLDMIVANQVGKDLCFGKDDNQVTVITKQQQITIPSVHKIRLAGQLIAIIAATLQNSAL